MNSKQKNNSNKLLTREDIDSYISTKDDKFKHSIENKISSSSFENEALEGWDSSKYSTNIMKSIDKKFLQKSYAYTLTLGSCIALISIILFIYNSSEKETKNKNLNTAKAVEKNDVSQTKNISNQTKLIVKNEIQITTIQRNFKLKQVQETSKKINNEQKNTTIGTLPLSKIKNPSFEIEILKNQKKGTEIYFYDVKLIDYRNYRFESKINSNDILLNGTPASLERQNVSEKKIDPTDEQNEIPYITFLEKTIGVFTKGNAKKALTKFELILKNYPTDINANFYGGICYFNLKEYQKAISCFDKCLHSEFNNFNEEAEWYLAKSYLADHQNEKAKNLFKKIIKSGGFYSSQAIAFDNVK